MSQNYNLNSNFGFNVSKNGLGHTVDAQKTDILASKKSLFNSIGDFFQKNEKVFNGDVEKEINLYSRQMMIVGMSLKELDSNSRRRFDMNI